MMSQTLPSVPTGEKEWRYSQGWLGKVGECSQKVNCVLDRKLFSFVYSLLCDYINIVVNLVVNMFSQSIILSLYITFKTHCPSLLTPRPPPQPRPLLHLECIGPTNLKEYDNKHRGGSMRAIILPETIILTKANSSTVSTKGKGWPEYCLWLWSVPYFHYPTSLILYAIIMHYFAYSMIECMGVGLTEPGFSSIWKSNQGHRIISPKPCN